MAYNWITYMHPFRQGLSHKQDGDTPCQDYGLIKENDQCIVACLADGLGSLKYSHIASKLVVESVTSLLVDYNFEEDNLIQLKQQILNVAKNSVNDYCRDHQMDSNQMDCTLLFVVVLKQKQQYIYGQLGDGAICVVYKDHGIQLGTKTLESGFSNMTKTIFSSDALDYFKLEKTDINDIYGFMMTTDGLKNEIYVKGNRLKRNVEWYYRLISNETFEEAKAKIDHRWDQLTSDVRFNFIDDMSLIAIVLKDTTISLPDDLTWKCTCGQENPLEMNRCVACGQDFFNLFKDIDFNLYGGIVGYFSQMQTKDNELSEEKTTNSNKIEETNIAQTNDEEDLLVFTNHKEEIHQLKQINSKQNNMIVTLLIIIIFLLVVLTSK